MEDSANAVLSFLCYKQSCKVYYCIGTYSENFFPVENYKFIEYAHSSTLLDIDKFFLKEIVAIYIFISQ